MRFQLLWVNIKAGAAIAGSHGKSMFSFISSCQTASHSGCALLHSHQQWMRGHAAVYPRPHLALSVFWISATLIGITLFAYLHCPGNKHMSICHLSIVFGEGSVTLREHLKLSALRWPSGTGSAIRVWDLCEHSCYMCAGPVWTHMLYVCRICVNKQPHTEKALLSLP